MGRITTEAPKRADHKSSLKPLTNPHSPLKTHKIAITRHHYPGKSLIILPEIPPNNAEVTPLASYGSAIL